MRAAVLVVGDGQLAHLVCKELASECRIIPLTNLESDVPEEADLALLLQDAWHPYDYIAAEERLQEAGIPWLRGCVAFGEGIIGPLVRPGIPGCSHCANMRHLMAGHDRKEMWELRRQLAESGGIERDVWASRSGLQHMAHLLVAEACRVLRGGQEQLESRVILVQLKTLRSSRHFFLPDPECQACGRLADDSPEAARITLKPNPKISPNSYRTRSMDELKEVLVRDYLDFQTGFLNGKMPSLHGPFADMNINLPLFNGDETTAGRTVSYADSELTGILEGLERYCGFIPRGKQTVVYDSYRNLADHALNPVQVGVHTKEQYAQPDFPFKPFDPDRPIHWVWGYSFKREQPILVPELLAYYSMGFSGGYVFETSNGCALGGSLEEAIFYGIMEIVERDSFLMTWYGQLPLPRLDPDSAGDPELSLLIQRMKAVAGYDLYLYNSTMEHGIPSIWTFAKNTKGSGINIICAAGAHLDPVRAVKGAIFELAGMMLVLDGKFEARREEFRRMYEDGNLVRQMEDHSMLYSLPEAEERLQFLMQGDRPMRTFAEEYKERPKRADLTDDLKDVIGSFLRLDLDVIVVNQTTPELARNGLHCVKVLIPGMLPMTFGHHLTRVTGLERVLRVPAELGYAEKPLTLEQLNPHPHPFP